MPHPFEKDHFTPYRAGVNICPCAPRFLGNDFEKWRYWGRIFGENDTNTTRKAIHENDNLVQLHENMLNLLQNVFQAVFWLKSNLLYH